MIVRCIDVAGVLLPTCAIFFSLLLIIIYFTKERINLIENKFYSIMLIIILIDSILAATLQYICIGGVNDIKLLLIQILNKIDFAVLIIYSTSLFLYNLTITLKLEESKVKKFIGFSAIIDVIAILIIMFLNSLYNI